MNRNRKFGFALFWAGIIILFGGCKTTRTITSGALFKMEKEERIASIHYAAGRFNTLSSSLRFSVKPGMKKSTTSANARLQIVKDKIIRLSLRIPILGTEIAQINVTPEQIIIIDRTNKQYVSESMQKFQLITKLDFDFYSLQALFTNQLFIPGKSSLTPGDYNVFNWSEDEFFVKLNNTDNQGIQYDFISNSGNRIVQTEIYKNKKEINMNWLYKDFGSASDNRLFPMKMTMELTVPNDLITLNLTFNNVDIDTYFELDTSIPDRYQPVEIEKIIKLIQSLL